MAPTTTTTTTTTSSSTYEAIHASLALSTLPDPIAWEESWTVRRKSYRHLHHQQGVIGHVRVRLFEAKNLQRSGWSVLGLGPVRLLGLSKAVGEVSSYATCWLDYDEPHTTVGGDDRPYVVAAAHEGGNGTQETSHPGERFVSSIVPNSNNPVWKNKSHASCALPIRKRSMATDGMSVILHVRLDEDRTTAEALLPGNMGGTGDGALVGQGRLDVTEFLLHGDTANTGVREAWINLQHPHATPTTAQHEHEHEEGIDPSTYHSTAAASSTTSSTQESPPPPPLPSQRPSCGRIRVGISYEPHGMEPRMNDIIALECFARRPLASSSCPPIVHPLRPMRVVHTRAPFVLLEYTMPCTGGSADDVARWGTVKLHRNTVFVLERRTLADRAVHVLLSPADRVLSHPWGESTVRSLQPYVQTVGDKATPLLSSGKLLLGVLRTGAGAGAAGLGTVAKVLADGALNGLAHKKDAA